MSEETKTESTESVDIEKSDDGAESIVGAIEKMTDQQDKIGERLSELEKGLKDAKETQYPHGIPGSQSIRKGEDPLTSRPYSMLRLAKSLALKAEQSSEWRDQAKVEHELSDDLRKEYWERQSFSSSNFLVPLGADLMPTEETKLEDGTKVDGLSQELVNKCRDIMSPSLSGFDPDEYHYLQKKHGLQKDLSATTATSGGLLVGLASQGELIEQLKAQELFSQAGAQQISLPPQGRIQFPRVTGTLTIAATTEGATVSESTPSFGQLNLTAKPYSGLVDIPDELLKFSTSMATEAWLRSEFLTELRLQTDSDMINGAGGSTIQGVINYSGFRTVIASTTGANGDTLDPEDPTRLYADIADQNAPVDRGFFYACTNTLWGGLSTRRTTDGVFVFNVATHFLGNGKAQKSLSGEPVICTTQVPTNRAKGSGTDLTMLLGGVGSEWVIARAGVVEISVTNSDASKFQSRLSTMRGTVYMDAGPRHENSFGMIDDLLNS